MLFPIGILSAFVTLVFCAYAEGAPLNEILSDALNATYGKRILGGSDARQGAFPWMASIHINSPYITSVCGGSIVNKQWIITAAHCFGENFQDCEVKAYIGKLIFPETPVGRKCELPIIHPQYNGTHTLNNDVALLKLKKPLKFTERVSSIELVPSWFNTDKPGEPTFADKTCSVLGWGSTGGDTKLSRKLQVLNVQIQPREKCISVTRNSWYPVKRGESKFCAQGVENGDTCKGDSGGPLFCRHNDGIFYLHGIISYGKIICGTKGKPGVYAKIKDLEEWAQNVMASC